MNSTITSAPDPVAVQHELEECVGLFQEVAATAAPIPASYLFPVAAKAKETLDAAHGRGNDYSAQLVRVVMANVKSARDTVPAFVAQRILHLLRYALRMQGLAMLTVAR